jgi:hypothetical protein
MKNVKIQTERFMIRTLTVEDVGPEYLSWFKDSDVQKFIVHANTGMSIEKLTAYVKEKSQDPRTVFLGVFDQASGVHVGNIKFEPVDFDHKVAVLGILM